MNSKELLYMIRGCAEQDRSCQKLLYETWHSHNLRIAFRYVNTYGQAAEVTHQGFLNIFRNIHYLEIRDEEMAGSLLAGWMKRMVITAAIEFRKLRVTSHLPDPAPASKGPTDRKASADELIEMVKQLPLVCHLVFNLHVIDGYSHPEIAVMLNITPVASQSYLSTARLLLQEALSAIPNLSFQVRANLLE
jgi:DNA-directed RNA polymerase specialized sigma24 family protein